MINFTEPYHSYNQDKKNLEKAITKVLKDGSYILGKNVKLFEKNFSRYLNIKYSVAVANGTDAIHLGLKALNIGKGDEVIVPPLTMASTTFAADLAGLDLLLLPIVRCGALSSPLVRRLSV